MTRLPVVIHVMLAMDAAVRRGQVLVTRIREEIFLNWVPPSMRESVTFRIYEAYSPEAGDKRSREYPRELFSWEEELFTTEPFPAKGRVLLGAAGGGRELSWLVDRGYEVVAFEPSGLLRDAEKIAAGRPNAQILRASYREFTLGLESGDGPLCEACGASSFDAIILGWGSFSHVYDPQERTRLLDVLRCRWPNAPIFVSFFLRRDQVEVLVLRRRLRRLFSFLGAPGRPAIGLRFFHESGFAYAFTVDEIRQLASETGYSISRLNKTPYPHAVLSAEQSAQGA